MGQIEQAIGYMESSAERGAPIFNIRVMLNNAVPKNRIAEVEANPRFHRFLGSFDIDADWCSELSVLVQQDLNRYAASIGLRLSLVDSSQRRRDG